MGAEESRSDDYNFTCASVVERSMRMQVRHAGSWSLLQQCSLDQWMLGYAGAAGFTETTMTCTGMVKKECSATFCISRQGMINVNNSGPIFSFRRKSKFTKMAEHFEYNHIPAHLSSIQNFHVKSVLCCRSDVVVLHLVRNLMTQFGVIDLGAKKFTGIFGKKSVEFVNEALRGEISPDCGMCLIKIPSLTSSTTFDFQLYSLESREMLTQIVPPYNHAIFTFDPRFCGSRLAVTSFVKGEENSLSLVHLPGWEVMDTNTRVDDLRLSLSPHLQELQFSRDGHMIFVVLATGSCHCREKKVRRFHPADISIYVLHSDTAQTLHCIQYHRYTCPLHCCPTNYMPLMSVCSSRMAIILNDLITSIDHVQVYRLPITGNLQNRCRVCILQSFAADTIRKLPLPTRLISYLLYTPERR